METGYHVVRTIPPNEIRCPITRSLRSIVAMQFGDEMVWVFEEYFANQDCLDLDPFNTIS